MVELTGWRRDYARTALLDALVLKIIKPRPGRTPLYGPDLLPPLIRCWAVLPGPAVTDISTGWTVNRSVRNKAAKWVFEALEYVTAVFPFPIIGIDSDNGSEFINEHLLAYCHAQQITFTRSRPGNKNDGAHVEQKNWARVRELVGYLRYDTAAELEKLNAIWELDRVFTNYLLPQQKLLSKQRHGAKVTKKHDTPATPHQRALKHARMRNGRSFR